tara:strand:- start:506 stop:1054 length:549 start_codon:yes stop_codon:yes gene_type:complete
MNQESREIKTFGPLLIESGTQRVGAAGKTVYFIGSKNKDGVANNISFHEGKGIARYYTEKEFQVEAGVKCKDNQIAYKTIVHHGSYSVNADRGDIKLKGRNIILEADDEIQIKASNLVQIGYPEPGGTKEIRLNADLVDVTTKGGNVGDILKTSSLFAAFAGSFVPQYAIAKAAAKMYKRLF